jgi:GTP-binding nuclear protein Ran
MNCLLVGDRFVGKSSFVNRLVHGTFDNSAITPVTTSYFTNIGSFAITICEIPLSHIDCAIVMFDVSNIDTFENVALYVNSIRVAHGNIPIIVCGNKYDVCDKQLTTTVIGKMLAKTNNVYYLNISAKSFYNMDRPLLYLIRLVQNPMITTWKSLDESDIIYVEQPDE